MNLKSVITASLLALLLGTGCVRRAVSPDFGLTPRPAPQPPAPSFRSIFKQQIQGAFNPLSDDPRVQQLQTRLKANSQDIAARMQLGDIYESYRLYDKAFEQYMEAARPLAPDTALAEPAVLGLSRSARASHRSAEALLFLDALVKQRPSATSWNELGVLYEDTHDLRAAENAFEQALAANPEWDSVHNNLGYNLLLQNRTEAAEASFRKALQLNPASVTARNNLGTILARRSDFEGALQQFEMTADAATAHNNLAVVLLEMGQYERSREELVQALTIRHSFAPALANFKLVQERIREQTEVQKFGRLPLTAIRLPSAIVALGETVPLMTKEPEDNR